MHDTLNGGLMPPVTARAWCLEARQSFAVTAPRVIALPSPKAEAVILPTLPTLNRSPAALARPLRAAHMRPGIMRDRNWHVRFFAWLFFQ